MSRHYDTPEASMQAQHDIAMNENREADVADSIEDQRNASFAANDAKEDSIADQSTRDKADNENKK